ncbi:MAG TPA: ATP-binding protein, partial [Desulfatiglandales bacterium]|nr:ATP-binding protein [Desulfatiglandales bacterium]
YFGEILNAHYFFIALIYFLTFFYAIALKRIKKPSRFAYLQILIDTIFITTIIYTTGGIESFFSFLYLLNIISGGMILYRRGGMIIASFSSILYGALLDLSYYGLIAPMGQRLYYIQEYSSSVIFYRILVNVAAFYLAAFLSSFLSEQTRKSKAELKAKQEDLADLEMLKENIIQSISSGLVALDEHDKIIVFNKGAETIFNIDSKDARQRRINNIIPLIEPYLRAGNPNKFSQISYRRSDDKQIDLILNVSPLREQDGTKKGNILVFQDITHIREMEREVKRMEDLAVIGELAAGIAHEIRNPLASISGSIQVLGDSLSKEGAHINKRLMEIVLREINRLNNLVNDFLLFARPRRIEIEEVNLKQLIVDALDIFKNSQDWSQLEVETKFFGPLKIRSDPQQLKQVFWNIFLNACEAMPFGGLIRVSTDKVERYNERGELVDAVIIKVEDNGPGIDPKVINDMFKPFSTAKKDGSGLGLAIVKRIVEGFGGEVSCQNLEGRGASIKIILPLDIEVT